MGRTRPKAVKKRQPMGAYPLVATHLVASKHVDQTFRVQVMEPLRYPRERARFPVVYATDGNLLFDALKGISHCMQLTVVPRFILVAIGYPSESPLGGALLRGRDLMFPGYPKVKLTSIPVEGVLRAKKGTRQLYGAEAFRQFIERELVPLIDREHPTRPGERFFFGHSAGAGFGLFTLFTRPRLFRGYVLSSGGYSFDGKSSGGRHYRNHDFLFDKARGFIGRRSKPRGIHVYMSAGSEEEFDSAGNNWQFTSACLRMASLLKGVEGLSVTAEILPGERHLTAWPVSFIHGLRYILGSR